MIDNSMYKQEVDGLVNNWVECPKKTRKHKESYRKSKCIQVVSQNIKEESCLQELDLNLVYPYMLLDLLKNEMLDNVLMYYIVPSINGQKHGFGEIHFGGNYDGLVYSTSWKNNIPSGKGFLYNINTSEVICLVDGPEITMFDSSNAPHWDMIDKDNGERWEGLSYNGSPCGLGEYYDSENNLIYSGLCVNFFWEGYGRSYFPYTTQDNQLLIACEGHWCHSSPIGNAIRFDVQGDQMPGGLLLNGNICKPRLVLSGSRDFSSTHCFLEELVIGNNSLNTLETINLEMFRLLRKFIVGNYSCISCTQLLFSHNSELETIIVGDFSFSPYGSAIDLLLSESNEIMDNNKIVSIHDVGKLQEVRIGFGSFSDFCEFSITDAPQLKTLSFGKVRGDDLMTRCSCCFFYCRELSLRHLTELETVEIGDFSFYHTSSVMFYKLPSLTSIHIGQACFFRSLDSQGQLELIQLPALTTLSCAEQSFASVNSIVLRHVTSSHLKLNVCRSFWSLNDYDLDDVPKQVERQFEDLCH